MSFIKTKNPIIALALLLAASGPAIAGIPYALVAGGGGGGGGQCTPLDSCWCRDHPSDPQCVSKQAPFTAWTPHGISGIPETFRVSFEALPRAEETLHHEWIPSQGVLRLGDSSMALTHPVTGVNVWSKDLRGLLSAAPVDALVDPEVEGYQVLLKNGGIMSYIPATDTLQTLVDGGWTQDARGYVLHRAEKDHFVNALEGTLYRLYRVTPTSATPLGVPQTDPYLDMIGYYDAGPPERIGMAIAKDGRILGITDDGETFAVAPPMPPLERGAFVFGDEGLEAWGLEAGGLLNRVIVATGVTTTHNVPELLAGEGLSVGLSMPDFAAVGLAGEAGVRVVDSGLGTFPNILDLDLPALTPGVERRVAIGHFGLIPGLEAPVLAVAEYDPTLSSPSAHEIRFYSALLRQPNGQPAEIAPPFVPYPGAKAGVTLATLAGSDGIDCLLVGPGPGPNNGPQVKVIRLDDPSGPKVLANFYAYQTLRYGVNVTAGDFDGDGVHEIITGGGPGAVFGPHVRGFRFDQATRRVTAMAGVSFFAYQTLKYGVEVAAGDIDRDGQAEIITAPGPGPTFGAQLRAFRLDGGKVKPAGLNVMLETSCAGATVGVADTDGNGTAEVLAMLGADPADTVYVLENGSLEKRLEFAGTSSAMPYRLEFGLDGTWSGTSANGWTIGHRIFADNVTNAWVTFSVKNGTCEDSGTAVFMFTPPVPVIGNHFAYTAQDVITNLGVVLEVDANIAGNTMTGVLGITSSRCGASQSTTFTAIK